jgi:hypothetical protein
LIFWATTGYDKLILKLIKLFVGFVYWKIFTIFDINRKKTLSTSLGLGN